jgi:hypothetical protein
MNRELQTTNSYVLDSSQAAERSGVAAQIHLHTKAEADIPNEEDTALCPGLQVGEVTT